MGETTCRECGCTNARACTLAKPDHPIERCGWAFGELNLCTACVPGADPDWQHPPRRFHVKPGPTLRVDDLDLDDPGIQLEPTSWDLPQMRFTDDGGLGEPAGWLPSRLIARALDRYAPAVADLVDRAGLIARKVEVEPLREHPDTPQVSKPTAISLPLASTEATAIALGRMWLAEYARVESELEEIRVHWEDVAGKSHETVVEAGDPFEGPAFAKGGLIPQAPGKPLFLDDPGGLPELSGTLHRDFPPIGSVQIRLHNGRVVGGPWDGDEVHFLDGNQRPIWTPILSTQTQPPLEDNMDRTPPHGDDLDRAARRIDFATEIPPKPRAAEVPPVTPRAAMPGPEPIRIVSDGKPSGTHVYAGDEEIRHVTAVSFAIDLDGPAAAKVTTRAPELEAVVFTADIGPDPITELRFVVAEGTAGPTHKGPEFIELEQQDGKSVGCFEWVSEPESKLRYLRIPVKPWQPDQQQLIDALKEAQHDRDQAVDGLAEAQAAAAKLIDERNLARQERDTARLNMARLHNPLSEAAAIDETEGVIPYLEGEVAKAKARADSVVPTIAALRIDADRLEKVDAEVVGADLASYMREVEAPALRRWAERLEWPLQERRPEGAGEGVVPEGAAEGVVPASPPQHEAALERLVNLMASSVDQLKLTFDPQMGGAWIITGLRAGPGQSPKARSGDTFLSNSDLVVLRRFHEEVAAERRSLEGRIMREVEAKESLRAQLKQTETELDAQRQMYAGFVDTINKHLESVYGAARTLVKHLMGDEPAWWVEAAEALAKLQRLTEAPAGKGEPAGEGPGSPRRAGGMEPPV